MERDELRKLLRRVRAGQTSVEQALQQVRLQPLEELGFATLDLDRARRRGFPEAVYAPGKQPEQIVEIAQSLHRAGQSVLVTRVEPEMGRAVVRALPEIEVHATARALVLRHGRKLAGRRGIVVVTAGTADQQVGEEAALTAELMGQRVQRIRDVGIAGLHRLLAQRKALLRARVIVAVAGMEGALPSVIAGLTDCPVIGVPTSCGYGAGGRGEAALLAMLNSCASGLTVVNIDNGYGAGCAAGLINRR